MAVGYLNSGGRYNPSTDVWMATSTSGTPTAREYHTAVWTGSEMIIWGGDGGLGHAGGRYNPNTNTWVATSMSGEPTNRAHHTAVWTGSEMIVWGGGDPGISVYDNGGKYNPSTDTWVATTQNGTPSNRALHTAVWTGSEMIVWGGVGVDASFNSGGRYNPSTNSWVATSFNGAPYVRYGGFDHGVWTGTEMIVWGGNSSNWREIQSEHGHLGCDKPKRRAAAAVL